jgi:hypothetical protein
MSLFVTAEQLLPAMLQQVGSPREDTVTVDGPHASVLGWLGRLRLLHGVPFAYLVPDDGLLRPESVRFFHLDRRWNDALVEGALSVGTFDTRDRSTLHEAYPTLRGVIDDAERRERLEPPSSSLPAANVTGLLLRSGAVSGWPGLHVGATRRVGGDHIPVRLLRMERLAPAVLLVLFEDIPDQVTVAEPGAGIQFGVEAVDDGKWELPVRDPARSDGGLLPTRPVPVPFRKGSSGVIHIVKLLEELGEKGGLISSGDNDSAALALQLLRRPYIQPFGSDGPFGSDAADDAPGDPGGGFRVFFDVEHLRRSVDHALGGGS